MWGIDLAKLLEGNTIEKIMGIFATHQFINIRLIKPQFSDQNNKINFLVESTEATNPFAANHVITQISPLLKTPVNIIIESDLDSELADLVKKNFIAFSRESIQNLDCSFDDSDTRSHFSPHK